MTDTLIYPVGAARFFFRATTLAPLSVDEMAAVEWDFAAVYGAGSELILTSEQGGGVGVPASEFTAYNAVFQAVVMVVLGVYCVMVYHFRRQIAVAVRSLSNLRSEECAGDENKYFTNRFLIFAMVLGCVVAGIFAVNASRTAGEDLPLAFLPVAVAVAAISLTKFAALKIAGWLTFTGELTQTVIRAKRTFFATATMLATPFVLLSMGGDAVRSTVFLAFAATVVALAGAIFALRSFRLFREQKISFLVWILYLCAVEIFPIGFVLLLTAKNS